uniref:Uncharacterized protein n=1 Tax=Siphoviridae sp. ctzO58 TaxID=2825748 RepID=A0A8S5UWS4_9CAUD|nr:MAG TPA: hypothetical protein [Siphoviridae sp. ctzO58]
MIFDKKGYLLAFKSLPTEHRGIVHASRRYAWSVISGPR